MRMPAMNANVAAAASFFVVLMCGAVSVPPSAFAIRSFGPAVPFTTISQTDQDDFPNSPDKEPVAATDGLGNWVAIWGSRNSLGGLLSGFQNVLTMRSSDNGDTWTAPVPLLAGALTQGEGDYAISTDGNGTWVTLTLDGTISRSLDAGANWTVVFTSPFYQGLTVGGVDLKTDGHGNWAAAWARNVGPFGASNFDIIVSHSGDNGLTWAAEQTLDQGLPGNDTNDFEPRIIVVDGGDWWVVWKRSDIVRAAKSIDNGATFPPSSPFDLGSTPCDLSPLLGLDVLRDSTGAWVVSRACTLGLFQPRLLVVSRSTDDGLTWGPLQMPAQGAYPKISRAADGTLYIVYSSDDSLQGSVDSDRDLMQISSLDSGVSWSEPAALTGSARFDGRLGAADLINSGAVVGDGAGRWITFFTSTWDYVKDQGQASSVGDDPDPFIAIADELCPLFPDPGCRLSTLNGSGRLRFTNKPGGKDRMSWKWLRGEATSADDFRTATSAMPLALCFYQDDGNGPRLSFEKTIRGDAVVKPGKEAWRASSSGWVYKDGTRRNSAVSKMTLRAGLDGRAAIKISANGPSLDLPRMPVAATPAVTMQLHSVESAVCWSSTFSSPSTNTAKLFKARSD